MSKWWYKKYGSPPKDINDYTIEELYIEMLEDYYEERPEEIERFREQLKADKEWDGIVSAEYETSIKKWLEKHSKKNLAKKYVSDVELTEEDENNVMKNLEEKFTVKDSTEFEETF